MRYWVYPVPESMSTMGEVVALVEGEPLRGSEATAKVVAWLRCLADQLEQGASRPVEKAVLITHEGLGDKFLVSTAYCNATAIERAGMLSMSLHDTVDA